MQQQPRTHNGLESCDFRFIDGLRQLSQANDIDDAGSGQNRQTIIHIETAENVPGK